MRKRERALRRALECKARGDAELTYILFRSAVPGVTRDGTPCQDWEAWYAGLLQGLLVDADSRYPEAFDHWNADRGYHATYRRAFLDHWSALEQEYAHVEMS